MATETTRVAARAQRREELLDAADRVVRRRGGEPSMEEIAAEAGINDALAARYVAELADALQPAAQARGGRARFAASVDAYLSYIEREPERYRFVLAAAARPGTSGLVAEFRSAHIARCAVTADGNLRRAG